MKPTSDGAPMGHEFVGVIEELGSETDGLRTGDLVVASFAYQDNTCELCRAGVQTSCPHGGFFDEAQAEVIRVPQAAGTLVKLPVGEDSDLLPSLLTLADGGHGTRAVLEAVGYRNAYDQAFGVVRPGGVISRVGVPQYEEMPTPRPRY
jgi:threonine dehydrogenase-like Zn-dependent dehydrogenase